MSYKNFLSSFFLLIALLAIAITASAQNGNTGQDAPKTFDIGTLDGGNYVNDSFGMSLSVPTDWVVVSGNRTMEMVREAKKKITQLDQQKQSELDASIERSVVMLNMTKLPAGSPNNASFMLIAEKPPSPDVKTGTDVINLMRNAFKGSNASIEFIGEPQTQRIGGADFAFIVIKNNSPIGNYMQKVYMTVKNGYALEFFYTFVPGGDLAPMDAIIKSVKFK